MASSKKRLFLILWLAGISGVLSLLLLDISALIIAIPQPEGAPPLELPPPLLLKLASITQSTVLMSLAVVVGIFLAQKVGLHAPVAEAFANRDEPLPSLMPQLLPGIIAGILSGVAIVIIWLVAKPFLTAEFISRADEFNKLIPHAMRILYGGFTEEILLRWGFMTFLVWLLSQIFRRRDAAPGPIIFVVSIIGSALAFGAGHLPIASVLAGGLTMPLVIYVMTANSIFGIMAGFLYWRFGLEAAMIAHMFVHVVLIAAIAFSI